MIATTLSMAPSGVRCARLIGTVLAGYLHCAAAQQGPSGVYTGPDSSAEIEVEFDSAGMAQRPPQFEPPSRIQQVGWRRWLQTARTRQQAPELYRHAFIVESPHLDGYLVGIANRLLRGWSQPVPEIAIFVRANSSARNYSAETTPTREIFIHHGVLLQAESEDEVAAVLAHELAHVLLDHSFENAALRDSADALIATAEDAQTVISTVGNSQYDRTRKQLNTDARQVAADIEVMADKARLATTLYDCGHASLFSRPAENAADELAVDLLLAGGYSPNGATISLERLGSSYSLLAESSRTMGGEAMGLLSKATEQGEALRDQEVRRTMLTQFGEGAVKAFKGLAVKRATTRHPVPEERMEQVGRSIAKKASIDHLRTPLDMDSIEQLRAGPAGRALQAHRAANEAFELAEEHPEQARQLLGVALADGSSHGLFPAYVARTLKPGQGGVPGYALHNLTSGQRFLPVGPASDIAEEMVLRSQVAEADAFITQQEAAYGPALEFYPAKVRLVQRVHGNEAAQNMGKRCVQDAHDRESIARRCRELAGLAKKEKPLEKAVRGLGGRLFEAAKSLSAPE